MIDTLGYSMQLEKSGFTFEQSKGIAMIIGHLADKVFVTKADFKRLEEKTDARFEHFEYKMEKSMDALELRMTIKLACISVGTMTVLTALQHFLGKF